MSTQAAYEKLSQHILIVTVEFMKITVIELLNNCENITSKFFIIQYFKTLVFDIIENVKI